MSRRRHRDLQISPKQDKVIVAVAFMAMILIVIAGLAACGDDDEATPDDVEVRTDVLPYRTGWQTVTDLTTGETFSCLYTFETHGYGGGAGLWCHEVTP